ncbi:MAG TPA: hypothetical protein VG892_12600, partial [Terriglobales bacterium]|nr:hypothetical protein [Terriglobales bacterium]
MQRRNLILASAVLCAALCLYFFLCPWLRRIGADRACTGLYIILLLFYVYARSSRPAIRRPQ